MALGTPAERDEERARSRLEPRNVGPFDFLNPLLDANLGANGGLFADAESSGKLERAAMMTGRQRDETYGNLDIDLARNTAPLVAFSYQTRQDFFSARIGCQAYVPSYGMDLAALCIRR